MATKKAKKKTPSLHFVLEGKVFVEDRVGKKVVSAYELPGDMVLKVLIAAFEHGISVMEQKKP